MLYGPRRLEKQVNISILVGESGRMKQQEKQKHEQVSFDANASIPWMHNNQEIFVFNPWTLVWIH